MRGAVPAMATHPLSPPVWGTLACVLVPLLIGCGEGSGADEDGAGTPEERLLALEDENPDGSVPVALGFGRPVPDSALASLLTRNRLRPYALFVKAGGMTAERRVPRSQASLELIAVSREDALGQLRVSLCAQPNRVRVMLEDAPGLPDEDGGRRAAAILTHVDRLQAGLRDLATGRPVFYGAEVVGSAADVRSAREEPLLATFEPGAWTVVDGQRRIVVPQPALEAGQAEPDVAPEFATLGPDELGERLRALAEGITGCDQVEPLVP